MERNIHKKMRDAMPQEKVAEYSNRICSKLLQSDWYANSVTIYGFYPLENEVNCLLVLKQALIDGKRVALPKTLPEGQMEFYQVTDLALVREGAFHVMEPIESCPMIQDARAVAIVPGLVFDKHGNRMGYGKGYYDRYFARFPEIQRMAVAYEHQIEEQLTVKATDIPMHCIYTEQQIYRNWGKCHGIVGTMQSGKRSE